MRTLRRWDGPDPWEAPAGVAVSLGYLLLCCALSAVVGAAVALNLYGDDAVRPLPPTVAYGWQSQR